MTYEEFRGDVFKNIKDLPNSWRKYLIILNLSIKLQEKCNLIMV